MSDTANTMSSTGETSSLKSGVRDQVDSAKGAFNETHADLKNKAGELAQDAKETVTRKAEDAKKGLGNGIKTFGGALRAAGVHLSENGQSGTSRMVSEAASGIERLADSLENKGLGEIFDELRSLGRNNAGGLFAGSLLAGLAIGRLVRASESGSNSQGSASSLSSSGNSSGARADVGTGLGDGDEPSDTRSPTPTATSGYAL